MPRCLQVILGIVFVAFTVISFPRYPDNPGILSKKLDTKRKERPLSSVRLYGVVPREQGFCVTVAA